jgi:RNA polymerase sporulation-specific sigma factor
MVYLTNEDLALKIKAGEQEYLPVLWGQIRRLIVIMAYRYKTLQKLYYYTDIEDFIQCGYFAMLDSIDSYQPEKGYKFNTYLKYTYQNSIREEITGKRTNKLLPPTSSLNKPVNEDNVELMELLPDVEVEFTESLEREELKTVVNAAVKSLEPLQADVIHRHYYQDKSVSQIGIELNMNTSEVISIKRKALNKLGHMRFILEIYAEYFCPYEYDYRYPVLKKEIRTLRKR